MTTIGNCTTAGCQVTDGGSCIEGFEDLTECPNFSPSNPDGAEPQRDGDVSLNTSTPGSDDDADSPSLALPSGNALTVEEGHQLTSECAAKLVVLMGMVESGKTTVLAELYERFCVGPFAGCVFAGSKTLIGFERICYLSRAVSQRDVEDTDRTKRGTDNNLLHLDLVVRGTGRRQRLLISDLSGELFEAATASNEGVYAIPYLRRADHIVLFADAEKLGNTSERQHLLNQLLVLIRACTEESRISPSCRVTVVVSRHDLLPTEIDPVFIESIEARIRRRTDEYFDEPARFMELAARPLSGPAHAYGLAELIGGWLHEPTVSGAGMPSIAESDDPAMREIDRFAYKVIGHDR